MGAVFTRMCARQYASEPVGALFIGAVLLDPAWLTGKLEVTRRRANNTAIFICPIISHERASGKDSTDFTQPLDRDRSR